MKKIINPQPIIDNLTARCLKAKGVECSILGEVIDMLRAAPDLGEGAGFVLLGDVHVNANQIRCFEWKNGELCIWYAGHRFFEHMDDPHRKLYKDLCYHLGAMPTEDTEETV